jgi:hypothetical protein
MSPDPSVRLATNAISATGSHLDKGNELFGQVNGIQPLDDETVRAQIGQVKLLLPAELKLLVGRRVFLARTDEHEYAAWIVPEEEHVPPVQAICPPGITLDEICREIESGNLIAFLKIQLGDRVDLSRIGFSLLTAPDAERLEMPDRSASTGSEPQSQIIHEQNLKACGKDAATAKEPRTRAKAGSKRVRA